MKLSDYKVGDSVYFYLHRSVQGIDQLHMYTTNYISDKAIIHYILPDGSYKVRWDAISQPCDGAVLVPLAYPVLVPLAYPYSHFGIHTWEVSVSGPSMWDVLPYPHGTQITSTTTTTPIVKQDQPCRQCQRKNSVGVSSCWWCCCPNPC